MNDRTRRTIIVLSIAFALHGIAFGVLATNQGLRDWLFADSEETGSYSVSPDRLEEIVSAIRNHTREQWLEKLTAISTVNQQLDDIRAEHFQRVTSRKDQAYLNDLIRFSAENHQTVDEYNLIAADVSLDTVYRACRDAERQLVNTYREIVAAKNAIKLEVPALDAVAFVKAVPPERIDLQRAALDKRVRSKRNGDLDRFKNNVTRGDAEIDAMVKHAAKIIEKISGEEDGDGMQGWEQISDIALGSRAGETIRPNELNMDDQGTSDGGFNPVGGRQIGPKGSQNRNLFIDKWYVVGPFENKMRSNLDAAFLPESVIDLESTTLGKGGKEIGWEYWRRNNLRIEPAMAARGSVYYGWTEVYVEEAGSYWVSMGSDDYGKMWLNGDLVWKSRPEAKSFRADEETLELEFKQGVNEILFRCENNGGTMGWSVIIHLEQE